MHILYMDMGVHNRDMGCTLYRDMGCTLYRDVGCTLCMDMGVHTI